MLRRVAHRGPEIDFGGSGDPSIGGPESSIGGADRWMQRCANGDTYSVTLCVS